MLEVTSAARRTCVAGRGTAGLARRVPYVACRDVRAVVGALRGLAPRTVLVDVEPMIAGWNTDRGVLDAGVAAFLDAVAADGVECDVVFATNAWRRPSTLVVRPGGSEFGYFAHAGKPFRALRYRKLPTPGVVVGDQIATDGVLAWRLGYAFVHYVPGGLSLPRGPRVMRALGRPLRHVLFRDS